MVPKYNLCTSRQQFLYNGINIWNQTVDTVNKFGLNSNFLSDLSNSSCIAKKGFKNTLIKLQTSGNPEIWERPNFASNWMLSSSSHRFYLIISLFNWITINYIRKDLYNSHNGKRYLINDNYLQSKLSNVFHNLLSDTLVPIYSVMMLSQWTDSWLILMKFNYWLGMVQCACFCWWIALINAKLNCSLN